MGIFDMFGKDDANDKAAAPRAEPTGKLAQSANKLVERLLDIGIDGRGTFDSAQQVADDAMRRRSDPARAIDDIVAAHTKLAAAGGFVTGLGGFITLPVALPANVAGFYIIATRMAAAIAAVRGYDLRDPSVRSAILLSLVGADADDLLKKAGYATTGRLSNLVTERLPGTVLMAVNKGVGFRLLTQVGKKTFAKLGRGVPFVGGILGAGLDGFMIHRLADHVKHEFPPHDTLPALTN